MNQKQIKNNSTQELSINQLNHKNLCNIINKVLIGNNNQQLINLMIINKDISFIKVMKVKNRMIQKFNN